jgi:hypothetical protein
MPGRGGSRADGEEGSWRAGLDTITTSLIVGCPRPVLSRTLFDAGETFRAHAVGRDQT